MQWKNRNAQSIHEAINMKSNGMADAFLYEDHTFYRIQNAKEMADRLLACVYHGDPITIIGDYDVDGVHASAGLRLALQAAGAGNVRVRLPRRMSEGYGLKSSIVDEVDRGVLVTVDNGIAALEAVAKAKAKGLCVLVIDHHLPVMGNGCVYLPDADLIVDPHVDDRLIAKGRREQTTYREYCGAGLVYKIAQLMIPGTPALEQIAAFAAIATIADVVPLTGDNRNIYKAGMRSIQQGNVPAGLWAVIDSLKSGGYLTESDIGFKIAPMINAPGRLYDAGAELSLQAVSAWEPAEASSLAAELHMANEERKHLKKEAVDRAVCMVEQYGYAYTNPLVIVDPLTPEGIVGLVAGELQERYNASAIVFTDKGDYLKGSARAAARDDLKSALDRVHDLHPEIFLGYGGHRQAAGVSIKKEYLDLFRTCMEQSMSGWEPAPDSILYDMEVQAGQLQGIAAELKRYEPFGNGNPKPVFCIRNFKLVPYKSQFYQILKEGSVKFFGAGCEAVGFGLMNVYEREQKPKEIDMVGTVGYHYFMGHPSVQIEILDLKASERQSQVRSGLFLSIADVLRANGIG